MTTKHCKFCKSDKDLELFPKNRAMKDGRDNRCKDCWKIYSAEKRARGKVNPVAKFSKQPAERSETITRHNILTEDVSSLQEQVEIIPISHLRKLPGDRKFYEWCGPLAQGLERYKELYGFHAQLVYTYTGNFARHFIG